MHGRRGELARDSAVRHSRLFVAAEIDEIEHGNRELNVILRLATAVDEAWLMELFPTAFSERTEVAFDASGKRVISKQVTLFRDVVLRTKLAGPPAEEAAASLLAHAVLNGRFTLKHWTPAVDQWLYRLNSLAHWCPELGLTPISEAERLFLLQQMCLGSFSARRLKTSRSGQCSRTGWRQGGGPSWTYAPERFLLPCGHSARIRYAADAPPVLSARIQDLYGLTQTPTPYCHGPAATGGGDSRPQSAADTGDSRSRRVLDTHISCSEEGTAKALSETWWR